MSANAVVAGTFADFKIVKSRSVAQLIIELPLEQAQDAIEMFGVPMPGAEIWVAVARLVKAPEPTAKPIDQAKSERAKESYRSLDAMGQAVVRACTLCKEKTFDKFLYERNPFVSGDTEHRLKMIIGISSRREIGTDEAAYQRYLALETEFKIATGQMADPR